jgi:hypothetical protein
MLSNGYVGINNNNPAYTLDVAGNAQIGGQLIVSSAAGQALLVGSNTASGSAGMLRLTNASGSNYIQSGSNSTGGTAAPLLFTTMNAGAEWARFDATGKLGIGTNAPATNLDISGNVHIATDPFQAGYPGQTAQLAVMFRYLYGGTTQTTNHIEMGSSRTDNSDYGQTNRYVFATNQTNTGGLDFYINRLQVAAASYTGALTTLTPFTIYRNGNVGINNIAPAYTLDVTGTIRATVDVTVTSDMRTKTNVETLSNALSKVNALRGVSYTSKADPSIQKIGVIAQEIEKVLPEVVMTDTSPEQTKSVTYGNITAVLIEAIKELTQRLQSLEKLMVMK